MLKGQSPFIELVFHSLSGHGFVREGGLGEQFARPPPLKMALPHPPEKGHNSYMHRGTGKLRYEAKFTNSRFPRPLAVFFVDERCLH